MASLIGGHYTKNGLKQLPARVILSLNGVGLGGDELHPDAIAIVRDTRVFPNGETTSDFHTFDPIATGINWEEYGDYWYHGRTEGGGNFKTAWDLNVAHYYQIQNEQGGGGTDEFAMQRTVDIERAICWAANKDGRRCGILNLAGGSPDFESWKRVYVPFIVEAWEHGQNPYCRHLYGGPDLVDAFGDPLPGQPQRVIAELEYLKSIGYQGGVILTECGFNGGYGTVSFQLFEQQVVDWQTVLLPYADMLIGFCVWELGSTEFEADYTDHMQQLLPYLQTVNLPRWTPPVSPPPVDDGEEIMPVKKNDIVTIRGWQGWKVGQPRIRALYNDGAANVYGAWINFDLPVPPINDLRGVEISFPLELIEEDVEEPSIPPPIPDIVFTDLTDTLPKHPTLTYDERSGGEDDVTAITIHHTVSGSSLADITGIANFHVNTRGWPGIAYHFCIPADGEIYQTNRLIDRSFHSGGNNHYSVGIALLGDFTNKPPTALQLASCEKLVDYLIGVRLNKVNHIWGHRDMPTAPGSGTQCPGNSYLDWISPIANKPLPLPSTKFTGGETVKITSSSALNLRATPFGTVIGTYPSGTELIVSHPYCVRATGFNWWAVEVGGQKGWMAENYLELADGGGAQMFDMATCYLPGASATHSDIIIKKNNWGQGDERTQIIVEAGKIYITKGSNHERYSIHDGAVHYEVDTSISDSDMAKVSSPQGWIAAQMAVGQQYVAVEDVTILDKGSCTVKNQYTGTFIRQLANVHTSYTVPESGFVYSNVRELWWVDASGNWIEKHWFAPGLPRIRWVNNEGRVSWVHEHIKLGDQGNNTIDKKCV